LLSLQVGLSLLDAAAMSLLVYAGSAQLAALSMLEAGAAALSIIGTTFMINLRHLLMSSALSPHLGNFKKQLQVLFAYQLTDETFVLHSYYFRKQEISSGAELLATNMGAHLAWVLSSVLGYLAGTFMEAEGLAGLEYALPAMFIALLVMQIKEKVYVVVAAVAALVSGLINIYFPGNVNVLAGAIVAASVGTGWVLWKKQLYY